MLAISAALAYWCGTTDMFFHGRCQADLVTAANQVIARGVSVSNRASKALRMYTHPMLRHIPCKVLFPAQARGQRVLQV
eukprot:3891992-Amphidinium_carterae.1